MSSGRIPWSARQSPAVTLHCPAPQSACVLHAVAEVGSGAPVERISGAPNRL